MIRYVLNTLGSSFRSALAVGVGLPFLIAASAFAQEATTERVIVTGSYIPTAETESALPVTIYTAEVLQKQGANTPVEGLRQLPSFVGNTTTENDSNGGNGTAAINLRALGPVNTLTLMNGRRAFLGIQNNIGADINAIPIAALSRTEVLKDGASAVYGSDAVAGVVNFIMLNGPGEKPYEGAELYALYGNTTETDAHVRQVYVRGGVTGLDGKVAIAAAGEYYSRANLFSRDRFAVAGTADQTNNPIGGAQRGGRNTNSPTYGGRVAVLPIGGGGAQQFVLVNLSNNNPSNVTNGSDPNGYRPFEPTPALAGTDPSRFNFRAFTPAIPAVEKANYYITGSYKIFGEGLQLYGDLMYSKTKQDNGLAASPFTNGQVGNLELSRRSAFNPFGNRLAQWRYRFHQEELGNRRNFFDHDYSRYVAGVKGDFNFKDNGFISHFGYDSGFVHEQFDELVTFFGDADGPTLGNQIALNVFNPFIGQNAPSTGTANIYNNTLSTGINPVTGVPNINTFRTGVPIGTANYDNVAAARAAAFVGRGFFYERDWLVDAKANAHLFPNLWNGGVDVAIGYEHRESRTNQIPDPVQVAGNQLGFNASPLTKYRQEVDSIFGEITIPFVTSTMNIPFVRSLEFSAAYRFEEFTDFDLFFQNPLTNEISFDNGGTPRLSLRYQPIADLTLRASWGQSFRSPSPNTLFDPGSQNFPQLFDVLRFEVLQPPGGVEQIGNIGLQPEETDAYSIGMVWTPKFLPGFTMTADWYQLFTSNVILSAADNAQIILTANGLSGIANGGIPTLFVDQVQRVSPTTPFSNLVSISGANTANAGKRLVEGLDVTAVYELPTERFGQFTFSGGWNHFFIWKAQARNEFGYTNFLGNYNNGTLPLAPGAIPFNKAFVRLEWQWKGLDFVATGNYIGDFEDDPAFFGGTGGFPLQNPPNRVIGGDIANPEFLLHHRVSEYETLDLQLSYEFIKPAAEPAPTVKDSKDSKNVMATEAATSSIWQRILWGSKFTVGVNNVFDRYPPTVLGAFNDNYDTSLYSIRNRYWYASLSKKF